MNHRVRFTIVVLASAVVLVAFLWAVAPGVR